MKRLLFNSIILLLCTFFLLAGTGLNAVHYCCNICREAGIVHVTEESCEVVHEEVEHHHACAHHHHDKSCHHSNGCWFKHLQTEEGCISQSITAPDANRMQLLHCIVPTGATELIHSIFPTYYKERILRQKTPPDVGRQILAADCQLVI